MTHWGICQGTHVIRDLFLYGVIVIKEDRLGEWKSKPFIFRYGSLTKMSIQSILQTTHIIFLFVLIGSCSNKGRALG